MKHWITISLAALVLAGGVIAAEAAERKRATASTKPLTFDNVRSFFSKTLRKRPID